MDGLAVHPLALTAKRLRSQSGQSVVELGGTLVWVLIAALLAWQLALVGWTAISTANTARTVARLYSREGDVQKATQAGYSSLSDAALGTGASVGFDGSKWTVTAKVPIVVPDIPGVFPGIPGLPITETAAMPTTS